MKEYELQQLMARKGLLNERIKEFLEKNILLKQPISKSEIKGHIHKAEHNLSFVRHQPEQYADWAVVGCYYACYHAALSLIMTKGYYSKNHRATLLILVKEFYKKELSKEDIETLSNFLDYEDVLFYVESKEKREDASYSSKTKFDAPTVENLRLKAVLFVSKIKSILGEQYLGSHSS